MEGPGRGGHVSSLADLCLAGVPVDEGGAEVEHQVDQQRPRVLGQEDGRPADLDTAVFEVENEVLVSESKVTKGVLVFQTFPLGFRSYFLSIDVLEFLFSSPNGFLNLSNSGFRAILATESNHRLASLSLNYLNFHI